MPTAAPVGATWRVPPRARSWVRGRVTPSLPRRTGTACRSSRVSSHRTAPAPRSAAVRASRGATSSAAASSTPISSGSATSSPMATRRPSTGWESCRVTPSRSPATGTSWAFAPRRATTTRSTTCSSATTRATRTSRPVPLHRSTNGAERSTTSACSSSRVSGTPDGRWGSLGARSTKCARSHRRSNGWARRRCSPRANDSSTTPHDSSTGRARVRPACARPSSARRMRRNAATLTRRSAPRCAP
jgi:hypothetical protein